MNIQWESLIRAIVPLSFMAIWALTSLFNRENKPKPNPQRPAPGPRPNAAPVAGARAAEPTLRWNSPAGVPASRPAPARPARADDEGILILSTDNRRPERDAGGRSAVLPSTKRPAKGKPVVPQRKVEPAPARSKLAGVTQSVNQHMTNATIEMSPVVGMPPVGSMPSLAQGSIASKAVDTSLLSPRTAAARALADPARLREAFILNEILQPPVSMRPRGGPSHA